ncbi:MAG: FtsX-like permease family protein, partial [Planctomycetota bacterium]
MRTLDRKLLRNLTSMRGQVIAIVLIIACGVASFVTVITAYRGLKASRDAYYRRYRMADVFAPLKRAPRSVLDDLRRVDGVRHVEGRIVFDVTLDLPGRPQPVSGRVLSVPDRRRRILNDLHLTTGRYFEGDGTREVIVAESFARAHGLTVGDRLRVLMNGRKEPLQIVATALSPEFVYLIQGVGKIAPDPEHFTVLWLSRTFAESVFDYRDAVNDVVATLARDARPADVIETFDRLLDRYGAFGAYALEDQASNRYLDSEIQGLEGTATMIPTVFLAVAAFVLNMLMGRLVRTQRMQIAILRAFGYSTQDLRRHYLRFALVVGVAGAVLGIGVGLYFARGVLDAYRAFYSFPVLAFRFDPVAISVAFLISLGFAALGALSAVRSVVRLTPAEGLAPEAPALYRRTLWERIPPLWRRLGFTGRMVARRLSRTKGRAALTVLGVALSASILLLSFFSYDAMAAMVDRQYRLVERQDVYVTFHTERGIEALYEMRSLPGVRVAEPELAVAVRLVHGWRNRRTVISGLAPRQTLRGLIDTRRGPVALPREGLLLSRKLADLLGARVGDTIGVEVLTGRKERFTARIESVVDEYLGAFAYARLDALSRWVDEDRAVTGARMSVDPEQKDVLGRALKTLPAVAGVGWKQDQRRLLRDMLADSQSIMLGVLVLFAGIITFGVLYNAARIAL